MDKNSDFIEKLVHINRITKVVKGGRRFGFSALVVVGNQNGKIGIAHAKAKQVPDAIKKATEVAKRNQLKIPLKDKLEHKMGSISIYTNLPRVLVYIKEKAHAKSEKIGREYP